MAKRFLWAFICLMFTHSVFASQLTATLQSGDKLSPFYGSNAFVDAYNAATDGDIITLSAGEFNPIDIAKSITIIGTYGFSFQNYEATLLSGFKVTANDVVIEGIRGSLTLNGCHNLIIRRSYIQNISDLKNYENEYHVNTSISDCMIENFGAMEYSNNLNINNCFINYISDTNQPDNLAFISHCRINIIARIHESIIGAGDYQTLYRNLDSIYKIPYAVFCNNYLGIICVLNSGIKGTYLDVPSSCEFRDNLFMTYFEEENTTESPCRIDGGENIAENNIRILWSTPLTKNGKPSFLLSDFKEYSHSDKEYGPFDPHFTPSIPSIISSEISSETDSNGYLRVKITAKANN